MRILVAGQLVEDIDQYNRIHEMMSFLVAPDSRMNDAAEAFGISHDEHAIYNVNTYQGIGVGESVTVLFTPLSGLLRQNTMIPLRYAPVTIELELVDSYTDPIFTGHITNPSNPGQPLASSDITVAASSTRWQINNVQVKTDICVLDNALDNSYAQHLLSGKESTNLLQHIRFPNADHLRSRRTTRQCITCAYSPKECIRDTTQGPW